MTTEISLGSLSGRRGNRSSTLQNSAPKKTAGWPSPAQDYYSGDLDLNQELISDPDATFLMTTSEDAMHGAGISSGDALIVTRSVTPKHGDIVVAIIDGELLVRRLEYRVQNGVAVVWLRAENPNYREITRSSTQGVEIWGVVTLCIHYLHKTAGRIQLRRNNVW